MQMFAVAQVDEDYPAVIAAAVHPATKGDALVEIGSRDLAAVMSTHVVFRTVGAGRASLHAAGPMMREVSGSRSRPYCTQRARKKTIRRCPTRPVWPRARCPNS